jgi:hypothetical protein
MVLNVLSGEMPVTDAIREAGLTRARYYQLETRALSAMLRTLTPGASEEGVESSPQKRIAQLEEKVRSLEKARRRSERLLLMTRRLLQGPDKPKARKTASTRSGSGPSRTSRKNTLVSPSSTPSPTGAGEP